MKIGQYLMKLYGVKSVTNVLGHVVNVSYAISV